MTEPPSLLARCLLARLDKHSKETACQDPTSETGIQKRLPARNESGWNLDRRADNGSDEKMKAVSAISTSPVTPALAKKVQGLPCPYRGVGGL